MQLSLLTHQRWRPQLLASLQPQPPWKIMSRRNVYGRPNVELTGAPDITVGLSFTRYPRYVPYISFLEIAAANIYFLCGFTTSCKSQPPTFVSFVALPPLPIIITDPFLSICLCHRILNAPTLHYLCIHATMPSCYHRMAKYSPVAWSSPLTIGQFS